MDKSSWFSPALDVAENIKNLYFMNTLIHIIKNLLCGLKHISFFEAPINPYIGNLLNAPLGAETSLKRNVLFSVPQAFIIKGFREGGLIHQKTTA